MLFLKLLTYILIGLHYYVRSLIRLHCENYQLKNHNKASQYSRHLTLRVGRTIINLSSNEIPASLITLNSIDNIPFNFNDNLEFVGSFQSHRLRREPNNNATAFIEKLSAINNQTLAPNRESNLKDNHTTSTSTVSGGDNETNKLFNNLNDSSATHFEVRDAGPGKGYGLFALCKIPINQYIGNYEGEVLNHR